MGEINITGKLFEAVCGTRPAEFCEPFLSGEEDIDDYFSDGYEWLEIDDIFHNYGPILGSCTITISDNSGRAKTFDRGQLSSEYVEVVRLSPANSKPLVILSLADERGMMHAANANVANIEDFNPKHVCLQILKIDLIEEAYEIVVGLKLGGRELDVEIDGEPDGVSSSIWGLDHHEKKA